MTTHISYKTAKMLKGFLRESAPEPIDCLYWIMVGMYSKNMRKGTIRSSSKVIGGYPAYQLHDLLSKPFCCVFEKAMKLPDTYCLPLYDILAEVYYECGMEAVEKELERMVKGK